MPESIQFSSTPNVPSFGFGRAVAVVALASALAAELVAGGGAGDAQDVTAAIVDRPRRREVRITETFVASQAPGHNLAVVASQDLASGFMPVELECRGEIQDFCPLGTRAGTSSPGSR